MAISVDETNKILRLNVQGDKYVNLEDAIQGPVILDGEFTLNDLKVITSVLELNPEM